MAYFLPRNNKWYSALVSMSSVYRYLATILLLMIIIYSWLFGVYYRSHALLRQYQLEVVALQERQEQAHQARIASNHLQQAIDRARKDLKIYVEEGSHASDKKPMMTIMNLAKQNGLAMKSCTVDAEHDHAWYTQDIASMHFNGSLEQIHAFFQSLQAAKILVAHELINLSAQNENNFQLACSFACTTLKPYTVSV